MVFIFRYVLHFTTYFCFTITGHERNTHNVDFELYFREMVTTETKSLLLNKFFKLIFWSIETKLLTIPHFIEKKSMTAINLSSLLLSELKGYLNIFKSTQGSVFSLT